MKQIEISQKIIKDMEKFKNQYSDISNSIASIKIENEKWSLKQILGHLIDSASNNHQRIKRLQIDQNINFPDYKRDEWLSVINYNSMKYSDLVSLLLSYNNFLAAVIENIKDEDLKNKWNIQWSESKNSISLGELIEHYSWHLEEHFFQF